MCARSILRVNNQNYLRRREHKLAVFGRSISAAFLGCGRRCSLIVATMPERVVGKDATGHVGWQCAPPSAAAHCFFLPAALAEARSIALAATTFLRLSSLPT